MTDDSPICDHCSNKATTQDNIYCPTSHYACDDFDCIKAAALALWEDSHEAVSE
jgi:hypothetical protein